MPHLTNPFVGQSPPSGALFIGIGIKHVESRLPMTQHHVALIYSAPGHECRLSQLEGDYKFVDCLWDGRSLWRGTPALDEVDMAVTIALLIDLNKSKPEIPYGFKSSGCTFKLDLATGDLKLSPDGPAVGLTCSTFICAVFRTLSLPLLVDAGWPSDRPEDLAWVSGMVGLIRYGTERLFAMRGNVPDPRVRPEEVVSAFGRDQWPVDYSDVHAIAQEIVQEVAAARLAH